MNSVTNSAISSSSPIIFWYYHLITVPKHVQSETKTIPNSNLSFKRLAGVSRYIRYKVVYGNKKQHNTLNMVTSVMSR